MRHQRNHGPPKKSEPIMVRVDPEMSDGIDIVCAARSRDRAELIRLYTRRGLEADLARIQAGEVLDDLGRTPPVSKKLRRAALAGVPRESHVDT